MKISELSFNDIIPQNMKDDKSIKGFAKAFDHILDLYREKVKLVTLFEHLSMLMHSQLDKTAEAIDIPWYDTGFDKEVKIKILERYMNMYYLSGTAEAIKETLSNIFGHTQVVPWYEYEGQPFHFKVIVAQTTDEDRVRVTVKTLDRITPARAVFDNVEKYSEADVNIYAIADVRRLERHMTVKRSEVPNG